MQRPRPRTTRTFARLRVACGGVAQLGERRVRNAEVGSSILLLSTTRNFQDASRTPGRPQSTRSTLVHHHRCRQAARGISAYSAALGRCRPSEALEDPWRASKNRGRRRGVALQGARSEHRKGGKNEGQLHFEMIRTLLEGEAVRPRTLITVSALSRQELSAMGTLPPGVHVFTKPLEQDRFVAALRNGR